MSKSGEQARLPQRMCAICRRRFDKPLLTRHVLAPGGALVPDAGQKMPGRGWYCCPEPECRARFASYRPRRRAGKGLGR